MDDRFKELLEGYAFTNATKVDWGDMDAFQHLNNTRYFRHFENARIEYGKQTGIMDRMQSDGIGPILAWTECKFIRPVLFPDTLITGARAVIIRGSEMTMEYTVVSEAQGRVVAVGSSVGVYYNYRKSERTPFPPDMIAKIEKVEGRAIPVEPEPESKSRSENGR